MLKPPSAQAEFLWLEQARRTAGPAYRRVADAIGQAVENGELQPGDQLPPQRSLAEQLGVDFTTITKAYALARSRGLIEGAVGRGTYVRRKPAEEAENTLDLSMNLPPPPEGLSLGSLLASTAQQVLTASDASILMAYHPGAGSPAQRAAAQAWLEPTLGRAPLDRLLVSAGAQTALSALLSPSVRRGDALVVEPLTYPGVLTAADRAGVRLVSAAADEEGLRPDSLEQRLGESGARMVYLCPTFQNPTAATMSLGRRSDIAAVLHRMDAVLIEDDAYGLLPANPLPAISALAPERSWHVATVSKTLTPGLRAAFIAAPDAAAADRAQAALRSLSLMASPLTMAILTRWIREGTASTLLKAIRSEAGARRAIAAEILPTALGGAESLHVWLDLPEGRDERDVRLDARDQGLAVVTSSAFCPGPSSRPGMRISLGGLQRRTELKRALQLARDILRQTNARASDVV